MIPIEEIRNLANLARLKLTPQEEESVQKDVSSILDYVGQVSGVSMPDKKEDGGLLRNVMRDDVPRDGGILAGKEGALVRAFPQSEKGYNVVRKIIQKDE